MTTFFQQIPHSEEVIREESNEHPTIDTQTDPPRDGNDDVSTTPRIDPTSFHSKPFEITTEDSLPDSSNGDGEITIALVHGDTSILLEDIVSMLLETTASLGDLASFFCCPVSSELSISVKCIHFNDRVERTIDIIGLRGLNGECSFDLVGPEQIVAETGERGEKDEHIPIDEDEMNKKENTRWTLPGDATIEEMKRDSQGDVKEEGEAMEEVKERPHKKRRKKMK
ncbi:hypothetical protein BLNAU_16301 [Blattamonas nauphoetae]|uniref:Uncharacterized protein n=1 Tax=Blattamonas nauphoetae TaxID=2049346 RepID=A0ABQ9XA18_9EUKA|nr:hypothetical protein BLNAU_16301 [Blattamonas nauphoetae]